MTRAHHDRLVARQRTIDACDRSARDAIHADPYALPPVSLPVDVSDAGQFPNIAAAIARAKELRGEI